MATVKYLSFLTTFNCFLILVCVPGGFTKDHCNFKVNIEQNLRNNGFHRNLSYVLTFVNDYDEILSGDGPENCHIGLEQILPVGLYFRPDEVGSPSVVKTPVNIEDSAEEAKTLTVRVFGPVNDWTVNLHLLLHARYHAATANGGTKRNVIEPPKIYLNCHDDRLLCDQSADTAVKNSFCPTGLYCMWTELPVDVEPSRLIWHVPVGNTQDYHVVAAGTALGVAAGSLYLLRAVHEYMLAGRRKNK